MAAPYLFHVYDRNESIAHVLVWHTPSWEGESDPTAGEVEAAHGLRPTAAEEAKRKALRALFDHSREAKSDTLGRIAAAAYRTDDGEGWELLMIGPDDQRPSLAGFMRLEAITSQTIPGRIEV